MPAADWAQIREQIAAHAYRFEARADGGVGAASPAQQWQARFEDGGQVSMHGRAGGTPWRLGLRLDGVGYGSRLQPPNGAPVARIDDGQVHYQWSEQLAETWSNDARGLEQWFWLAQRPAGAGDDDAPLTLRLAVDGDYQPQVVDDAVLLRGTRAGVPELRYHKLRAWDAQGRSVPGHLGVKDGALVLALDDRAAQYPLTIDPLIQQAYLKASNTGSQDTFGWSIAISGDTVVVGAPREPSNATGVDGDQTDNSLITAGAAYVFVRSGSSWSQQPYLKASNTGLSDWFGWSVAISGDTVVVGAYRESSNATGVNGDQADNSAPNAGAAYVFTRSGSTWSQQAYLKASNTGTADHFGTSVAISGDSVVVGAYEEASNATGVGGNQADNSTPGAGAAYVFLRSGSIWSQQAYLKASNTGAGDAFGTSVAISGDTVVVGAYGEDSNATGVGGNQADNSAADAGAAYVFTRSGSSWSQQAYLKASNAGAGDFFGAPVAISGDTVVVGANREASNATGVDGNQADNSAVDAGAAYVFLRSGSSWSQQAYLQFGASLAISGDTVVVGAPREDSNATGVDGNQADNSAVDSGAAYVFARSGSSWSQQAYLKASNTEASDEFGNSTAISGDTVVMGAWGESSSATGVDGDQADNGAFGSGAAYVFDLAIPPTLSGTPGPATVDSPYSFAPTLGPADVTLPVTFSLSAGTLPPGLDLDPASGEIAGTPTTLGSYAFTLRANNVAGSADLPLAITVGGIPPTLDGTPGPATVDSPYSFTPTLGPPNVTLPVTFSLTAGALPPGLDLEPATGEIDGTPTMPGSYAFTLRASNVAGNADLPLTIIVGGIPPTLDGTPGPATVDSPYSFTPTLGPANVTLPVTFSLSAGTLPPGLDLDPASGEIDGTPTTPGSYAFTLRASNVAGNADLPLTITVGAVGGIPPTRRLLPARPARPRWTVRTASRPRSARPM